MNLFLDMYVSSVIFGLTLSLRYTVLLQLDLHFLACHATFKNTFNIFQLKVRFSIFNQELKHRKLGGLTLAHIHIIWGEHGLPQNFEPGLHKLNSRPLTKFLDPVAQFAKQLNRISNKEDFVSRPHLDATPFT